MSETVRRSLVLGARRPLTARAAAILALLAAVGALACGAPTEPRATTASKRRNVVASADSTPNGGRSTQSDSTPGRGSGVATQPWY
jgi:hypothetical protein